MTVGIERWAACMGVDNGVACGVARADLSALLALTLLTALVWWVGARVFSCARTLASVAPMPWLSRRLSHWVKAHDYSEDEFLRADGADDVLCERRRRALDRLAEDLRVRHRASIAWADRVRDSFSDLRFTDANRVPFPFMRVMREKFNVCSVVTASEGPRLLGLDGHWTIDVGGSYGVNVAGTELYKQWIERGWARVKDLGAVLGPVHPVLAENIELLKHISRLDEVSFHMSGTEAVMAAVRLARFNTGRSLVVSFAGAYHGWWDGVQPGLGSERAIDDCLTLKDLHRGSLGVIRRRAHEIAAVLVNPVQAFHPNAPPPSDALLLTSDVRHMQESTERYADWLRELRRVCGACGVPLIFDEVYTGFRLAPGGAQEYFDVRADMVVYGKTLGGGLPVGVVCGNASLMRRFDAVHPMRIAYVVGTFSAHPMVMGAMREFLEWVIEPGSRERYDIANDACDRWALATNRALAEAEVPVRVVNLATVWTVQFSAPGRYNWLLQYYLRAAGLTLSWVGTGRCLASLDFTAADYNQVQNAVVEAATSMKRDGWWPSNNPERERRMKLQLIKEMLASLVQWPPAVKAFYGAVMQRKHDDHHASHNDFGNQMLHLLSSSVFVYCYVIIFNDLTTAMCLGLTSLFVRQFGHAILEPACHEEEALLLGYTTNNKSVIVLGYLLMPAIVIARSGDWSWSGFLADLPTIAVYWFAWTVFVVTLRVVYLTWKHDFRISMIWFVKLVTDPFTDVVTYFPRRAQRA